jgi:hypothetical protein
VRKQLAAVLAVGALSGFAVGQFTSPIVGVWSTDAGDLLKVISPVADAYDRNVKTAKSAPQVSQLADEALVPMTYALVKQNQEIIRLLRKLANE